MPSPNYDQAFELVRKLPLGELQLLRTAIDALLGNPAWLGKTEEQLTPQDRVTLSLMKKGLISSLPRTPTEEDLKRWREYKPIDIEGEPLSETIIRERR